MLTEETLLPIFTDIDPNTKSVSVAIDTVVMRDGEELSRNRVRQAFVPGDIEKVKEFIGATESPEITYLNTIWGDVETAPVVNYPSKDALLMALWERVVEGKETATDELQAAREQVKAEFPKPDEVVLK